MRAPTSLRPSMTSAASARAIPIRTVPRAAVDALVASAKREIETANDRAPPNLDAMRARGCPMSPVLSDLTIQSIDLARYNAEVIAAGLAVTLDIRSEIGDASPLDLILADLDAGKAVALWDSDEVMPPFALGRVGDLFVVCDGIGKRSNFVTLEAALKHGMTDFEGYRRGR